MIYVADKFGLSRRACLCPIFANVGAQAPESELLKVTGVDKRRKVALKLPDCSAPTSLWQGLDLHLGSRTL
jgi:hypothetical protein